MKVVLQALEEICCVPVRAEIQCSILEMRNGIFEDLLSTSERHLAPAERFQHALCAVFRAISSTAECPALCFVSFAVLAGFRGQSGMELSYTVSGCCSASGSLALHFAWLRGRGKVNQLCHCWTCHPLGFQSGNLPEHSAQSCFFQAYHLPKRSFSLSHSGVRQQHGEKWIPWTPLLILLGTT